ncbi:MAG: hypothetical protein IKO03_08470 [Lachnospiraceae bacterium]|nr:hypothetical protein [Lachnospiraceae bacterium]
MGRKSNKRKNNGKKNKNTADINVKVDAESNMLISEEFIVAQAEAFYLALKRIEEGKNKDQVPNSKAKWWESILMFINIVFFPWVILGKKKMNKQIYDELLVIPISSLLQVGGTITWITGAVGIFLMIAQKIPFTINLCLIFMFIMLISSMMIVSGKAFGEENDSTKIYAYSASLIALISCVVSIVSLFLR